MYSVLWEFLFKDYLLVWWSSWNLQGNKGAVWLSFYSQNLLY